MFLYNAQRGRPNAWGISLIVLFAGSFIWLGYEMFIGYREGSFREEFLIRNSNATEVWMYAREFKNVIDADDSFLEYQIVPKLNTEALTEYTVRYVKWINSNTPVTLYGQGDFFVFQDNNKYFIRSMSRLCAESIFTCVEFSSAVNITDESKEGHPELVHYSEEITYRAPYISRSYTRRYLRTNHQLFRRHIIKKMGGIVKPSLPIEEKQPEQSAEGTQPGTLPDNITRSEL